jgi:hypothetical protein
MNPYCKEVIEKYGIHKYVSVDCQARMEHLYTMMVYDFLSELTKDDTLGHQRLDMIKRLASKYHVRVE